MLHLFNDHKEMSAGDIVMEVLSWNRILFRNNPVETRNQTMAVFNHNTTSKSKYDALMKMNNGPNKNDELKKFMKEIYTPPIVRKKKKRSALFHQGKGS